MSMLGLIELISLLLVVIVVAILLYMSSDRLLPYRKSFGLQKAALAYSGSLEELKRTILPVRQSTFSYFEPTIWLYKDTATSAELLMTANYKNDVRIWFQPETILDGVHIVLDSSKNNRGGVSNLMHKRLPEQQVELEGDFSHHFRLFCNKGQQIITLQIIAPDMMAFLLEKAMDVDIEIIDNQVGIIVRRAARSKDQLQNAIHLTLQMHKLVDSIAKVTAL